MFVNERAALPTEPSSLLLLSSSIANLTPTNPINILGFIFDSSLRSAYTVPNITSLLPFQKSISSAEILILFQFDCCSLLFCDLPSCCSSLPTTPVQNSAAQSIHPLAFPQAVGHPLFIYKTLLASHSREIFSPCDDLQMKKISHFAIKLKHHHKTIKVNKTIRDR